jgi:hypothetical protein
MDADADAEVQKVIDANLGRASRLAASGDKHSAASAKVAKAQKPVRLASASGTAAPAAAAAAVK